MRNVSDQNCTGNKKKHFVITNCFFSENRGFFCDNLEKYLRTGQATDDNMAHAHCMLDT